MGSASKTNFSYKISPTYKINDESLIYATYSTGYKGPGVAYVSNVKTPYKAETVKNFELGFKSELFDRKVRLNIAAFYQKYKDFQAQDIRAINGVPTILIANAGGLRTKGVEVEVNVRATPTLSLNGGITYADSAFTDYLKGGVQLAGQRLTNAPRLTTVLGLSVDRPVNDRYTVHGNIGLSYRSKTYKLVAQPTSIQNGYALVNARASIGPSDDAWRLGVYARNLFDQDFFVQQKNFNFGTTRLTPNEGRRTVGAFASVKF